MNRPTVAALGIYAGAQLTEGCVLVPYWRTLSSAEFHAWYAANDRRLFVFYGAVTVLAAALAATSAIRARRPGRGWAIVSAALMVAALLLFPLYFADANARFAAAAIPPTDLAAELGRWAAWHWARTTMSLAALAAALAALRRPG